MLYERKLPLTNRESEVIKLVCQGYSNNEIAQKLYISPHTAKAHLSSIIYKFNAKNRTHVAYIYTFQYTQEIFNSLLKLRSTPLSEEFAKVPEGAVGS